MENDRITTEEAASMIGICPQAIRIQMKKGNLPIGYVFESGKTHQYIIYKHLVQEWLDGRAR